MTITQKILLLVLNVAWSRSSMLDSNVGLRKKADIKDLLACTQLEMYEEMIDPDELWEMIEEHFGEPSEAMKELKTRVECSILNSVLERSANELISSRLNVN